MWSASAPSRPSMPVVALLALLAAAAPRAARAGEDAKSGQALVGECTLPFTYMPESDLYALKRREFEMTRYHTCTYEDSQIGDSWCSTGPAGAFTGSWAPCEPVGLLDGDDTSPHSFEFHGGDGEMLMTDEPFTLGPGFTFEMWLKPMGANKRRSNTQWALTTHASVRFGVHGPHAQLVYSADGLRFIDEVDGQLAQGVFSKAVVAPEELELSAWTHVALAYDGAHLGVYADGRRVVWRTVTGRIEDEGDLTIGGDPDTPSETFHGAVDDIRVWMTGRSQREIVRNMLQSFHPDDVWKHGLFAYWPVTAADAEDENGEVKNVVARSVLEPPKQVRDNAAFDEPPDLHLTPYNSFSDDDSGYDKDKNKAKAEQPGHLIKVAATTLEESGGSRAERVPLARTLGGTELALTGGHAGTHVIASDSGSKLQLKAHGTFELWLQPHDKNHQSSRVLTVLYKEGSYALGYSAGEMVLWYYLAGRSNARGSSGVNGQIPIPSCKLTRGRWQHVALTFDKHGAYAFIDGVQCGQDKEAHGGDLLRTEGPLEIGGTLHNADSAYAGVLDEVRVWAKARSAEELAAMMLDAVSPTFEHDDRLDGLLAAYSFDEGRGRTAYAAHGVGSRDEPDEVRGATVVGSEYEWRLGTSPMSLAMGQARDPKPERFELAFTGRDHGAWVPAVTGERALDLKRDRAFTFECWFVYNGHTKDREGQVLATGGGAFELALSAPDHEEHGAPVLVFTLTGTPMVMVRSTPAFTPETGVWYHVALSANLRTNSVLLAVNGVELMRSDVPRGSGGGGPQTHGIEPPLILGNDRMGDRPLKGALHEVRLWSVSRSIEDIRARFLGRLILDSDEESRALDKARHSIGTELAGYWPLDEGLGDMTMDRSGNGRHLALNQNGAVWARATSPIARSFDGRFGVGYGLALGRCSFESGASHIAVPGSGSIDAGGGLTMELWLRLSSKKEPIDAAERLDDHLAEEDGEHRRALQETNTAAGHETPDEAYGRHRVIASREGEFEFGIEGGGELYLKVGNQKHNTQTTATPTEEAAAITNNRRRGPGAPTVAAPGVDLKPGNKEAEYDVPVGQWVHVAFAVDNEKAMLMMNGAPALDVKHGAGHISARRDTPLVIGGAVSPSGELDHELCGEVDEIRMWSTKRSAEEVAATYTAAVEPPNNRWTRFTGHERLPDALPSDSKDLVLSYSMDTGHGGRLFDESGKGNDGIIGGPLRGGGGAAIPVPAGAWTRSTALTDDSANGLVSLGYALRLSGNYLSGCESTRDIKAQVGGKPAGLTVQMWLRSDGSNGGRAGTEEALLLDEQAFQIVLERDGEVTWAFEGVELDAAKLNKLREAERKQVERANREKVETAPGSDQPYMVGPLYGHEQAAMLPEGRVRTGVYIDPDESWRQLAVVYAISRVEVVLDGAIVSSVPVKGRLRPQAPPSGKNADPALAAGVQLGGWRRYPHRTFHGALDEVAIWGEARTVAQITTTHLALLPLELRPGGASKNVPKRLAAYWRMNDGWGVKARDLTGHGFDLKCSETEPNEWDRSQVPPPGEERMCTVDDVRCEPAFTYKGRTYMGCTEDGWKRPWCFTDESRGIWQECKQPCAMLPDYGFPGQFTSVGRKSLNGWAIFFISLLVLLLLGAAGAGAFLFARRRSGRPIVLPSFDVRDACDDLAQKLASCCPGRGRNRAVRFNNSGSGRPGGSGGGGGGGGGGYRREYHDDDDDGDLDAYNARGSRQPASWSDAEAGRSDPYKRDGANGSGGAGGGVRSSPAPQAAAGSSSAAGGFDQFQDDML